MPHAGCKPAAAGLAGVSNAIVRGELPEIPIPGRLGLQAWPLRSAAR